MVKKSEGEKMQVRHWWDDYEKSEGGQAFTKRKKAAKGGSDEIKLRYVSLGYLGEK